MALRLYGLNTEQARLQYYAPTATLANLKATQYSGPNEDCDLANDVATGERRTLAAPASSPAGTTYFVAQLSVADHFSEFYLTGSSTPLPVTLTAFTATAAGPAAVRLTWATASEVNSARFEVERSADGVSFSKVDEVAAGRQQRHGPHLRLPRRRRPGRPQLLPPAASGPGRHGRLLARAHRDAGRRP